MSSPRLTRSRSWAGIAAAVLVALLFWWLQSLETGSSSDHYGASDPYGASDSSDSSTSVTEGPTGSATDSSTDPVSGLAWVDLADLPPEAADTVALIESDGPYPEDEDDGVFGNFEGILPDQPRGYYREYTVPTPGLDHRGARRIVAGSGGELYWTADHYASFERIRR